DYLLLPDDGKRYEVIDGELFVNAAPRLGHQRIQARIGRALLNYAERHKAGEVFFAPVDVLFSDHNVVQPDLLFLKTPGPDDDATKLEITPDLVIEIISIGNRKMDEVVKLRLYDTFAVPEYWIVDPEGEVVKIYRRTERRLASAEQVGIDGTVTTPLLPGFSLPARKIFR
ncbi:MAG TPA: Uma2 family endonuclease, partial [Thermoanaerobaculia bacterium]|nr:Uma2 family endonuclease [Thermoanaerobaculia bacterium]